MTPANQQANGHDNGRHCTAVPHFDRLNYFYGQMLGVRDFQGEQRYFREKLRLHNRCLHGHGVVCGLEVTAARGAAPAPQQQDTAAAPPDTAGPAQAQAPAAAGADRPRCFPRVQIECGMALDCRGNELVVRDPLCVDLWDHLSKEEQKKAEPQRTLTLYLYLCHHELPLEPVRPVLPETCGTARTCHYGKLRDSVCVKVTTEEPKPDERCGTCCEDCDESCELLARIEGFNPYEARPEIHIDMSVRRPLSTYRYNRVAGINWTHGGWYGHNGVDEMLHKGLRIKFTRPIHAQTIQPGVIDVLLYSGHGTIQGGVFHLHGTVKPWLAYGERGARGIAFDFGESRYERLSRGDRVMIILRGAFLLDYCCQPLDGAHVGGWVPFLEEHGVAADKTPEPPPANCGQRRGTHGLWTSGAGVPGTSFESWFFVQAEDQSQEEKKS